MPLTDKEFAALMKRVRSGDEQAARELFERYGKLIQNAIHRRLSPSLRSQFDSLDFVQDAWASFYNVDARQYTFETPRELMNFIRRLARNKLLEQYRKRRRTLKRARHQVQSLSPLEEELREETAGPYPTPSQVAIAQEQWSILIQDQPPKVQKALEMLRAGNSHREIADVLGVHPKMIQRLRAKVNRKLKCL